MSQYGNIPDMTASLNLNDNRIGNMRKRNCLSLLPYLFFLSFTASNILGFSNLKTVVSKEEKIRQKDSFSFAVIGDSQPRGLFGQPEAFRKIVSGVNGSGAEFAVHLGDKIKGSARADTVIKQHEEFFKVAKGLKVRMYHAAGNHDIKKSRENESIHEKLFGPLYYSFAHKSAFFIVLNTEAVGEEGSIGEKQMPWLEGELEKSRKYRDVFVFMHRPLYSAVFSGMDAIHFSSPGHRNGLAELFSRYGITALFCGHEHLYRASRHNGLLQVISGGGGAPFHFYPKGNFHHYMLVRVGKDTVDIEAVPIQ